MKLKGKVAIVTGGGQGIGEGISLAMAAEGAILGILDLNPETAGKVVDKIKADGGDGVAKKVDVTDYAAVEKAVKEIHEQFGSIDILVNNAGMDIMKPFLETDEELWDKLIKVDYKSFLIATHVCAKYMVEQNSGKIISISSDSARAGQMAEVLYCGTKGAIITSSKGLAREFARYNINVNVISPGICDTPLIQDLRKSERGEKIIQATTRMIPFRRIGQPSEIGDLAVFFASEDSKYITGQIMSINGGQQMIG
jgi:2-hydroxycyclohexanecarboxyl-CoA dehydrogenase